MERTVQSMSSSSVGAAWLPSARTMQPRRTSAASAWPRPLCNCNLCPSVSIRGSTVSPFPQILFDKQQVTQERQRAQRRQPAQAVAREQAHLLHLVNLRLRQSLQLIQLADVMVCISQQRGHQEQHHCNQDEP